MSTTTNIINFNPKSKEELDAVIESIKYLKSYDNIDSNIIVRSLVCFVRQNYYHYKNNKYNREIIKKIKEKGININDL